MNSRLAFFDPDENAIRARINPAHRHMQFSIVIENYNLVDSLTGLIVSVWTDDLAEHPVSFNFVDKVQDVNRPASAEFNLPPNTPGMEPPYTISLFSEDETLDMSAWRVYISWSSVLV
jgi:hypothetical protein